MTMKELGLVTPVDRLGQRGVIAVANATYRGSDPGVSRTLGEFDRQILLSLIAAKPFEQVVSAGATDQQRVQRLWKVSQDLVGRRVASSRPIAAKARAALSAFCEQPGVSRLSAAPISLNSGGEMRFMSDPDRGATSARNHFLGPLGDAAKFAAWAYTPFQRLAAPELYGLLATRAFTTNGLYLNLGYWKAARTIDEACAALALLVAEAAGMGPDDDVVDVGFGFADQDLLWMERFAPRHITGLNVTPVQVRLARHRVRRCGLADHITLIEGSATAMPLPDACCDIVTAVECAFHFHTRADFIAEAFRVLRPGGRLVLADVIRAAPEPEGWRRRMQDFSWRQFAQKFAVPAANADQRTPYTAKLRAGGFETVDVTPIGEHVFPGWHRALGEDEALFARLPLAGRLPYRLLLNLDARTVYGAFDYVLATARKPTQERMPNGAI